MQLIGLRFNILNEQKKKVSRLSTVDWSIEFKDIDEAASVTHRATPPS